MDHLHKLCIFSASHVMVSLVDNKINVSPTHSSVSNTKLHLIGNKINLSSELLISLISGSEESQLSDLLDGLKAYFSQRCCGSIRMGCPRQLRTKIM